MPGYQREELCCPSPSSWHHLQEATNAKPSNITSTKVDQKKETLYQTYSDTFPADQKLRERERERERETREKEDTEKSRLAYSEPEQGPAWCTVGLSLKDLARKKRFLLASDTSNSIA